MRRTDNKESRSNGGSTQKRSCHRGAAVGFENEFCTQNSDLWTPGKIWQLVFNFSDRQEPGAHCARGQSKEKLQAYKGKEKVRCVGVSLD